MRCSSRHSSLQHSSASQGTKYVAQLCLPVQAQVHHAAWRSGSIRRCAFQHWGWAAGLDDALGAGRLAAMQQCLLQSWQSVAGGLQQWLQAWLSYQRLAIQWDLFLSWSWKHFPNALSCNTRAALASAQVRRTVGEATAGHMQA
jgi:hypothetical protein